MTHTLPLTMPTHTSRARTKKPVLASAAVISILVAGTILTSTSNAYAATAPVGLGTVGSYSVLGGQTVTNTGPSFLDADLGVSPGTAITGFPPGIAGGQIHAGDAVAAQAQSDVVVAYNDAAGRAPTASIAGDLVGSTLTDGVYNSSGPIALSGTLTLDGQGDNNAVFIFQVASTLITASASSVSLINGAQACNVFWQVGSSATLGTNSLFTGTLMALTSISATTGTVIQGKTLARNGAVSLDNNVFSTPECVRTPTSSSSSSSATASTTSPATSTSAAPTSAAPSSTVSPSNPSDGASASASAASASAVLAAKAAAASSAAASARAAALAAANASSTDGYGAYDNGDGSGLDLAATGLNPNTARLFLLAPLLLVLGAALTYLARPTTRKPRPRHN